jgi:rhodanese-related sulfurtransferase
MTGSRVRAVAPAAPADAAAHFATRLRFETDCADVHADLATSVDGIVVLDVRDPAAYAAGHLPGARSLPHATIGPESTAGLPHDAVLVTYCWGPHCNGATRAAARLAALGFSVKEMLGGVAGWAAEGYRFDRSGIPASVANTIIAPGHA